MRRARSLPFVLAASPALAAGCGAHAGEDAPPSIQSDLRAVAGGAPAGDHAYWLGSVFHGATVTFADETWGRYAVLTDRERHEIDIDVETFRPLGSGRPSGFRVRTRTATGQDVVLVFHAPRRPGAALVRQAEAAVAPIPLHVTYP
jgi:ribosomal protein L34